MSSVLFEKYSLNESQTSKILSTTFLKESQRVGAFFKITKLVSSNSYWILLKIPASFGEWANQTEILPIKNSISQGIVLAASVAARCELCDKQWTLKRQGTFYFNFCRTELFFPRMTLAPSEPKPTKFSQGI